MRTAIAALVLALPLTLAACGDDTGDGAETAAEEPTTPSGTSSQEPTQEASPVRPGRTCRDLYQPPGQLMPRAIELVYDSPSGEDPSAAPDLAAKLADVEAAAADALATDIALIRTDVEAVGNGERIDKDAFNEATTRLAAHCELYVG